VKDLKERIMAYLAEVDDEIGAAEVAKKFHIAGSVAMKALKELHKDQRLACAQGCDTCEG
jgi:ribosomal protein S25